MEGKSEAIVSTTGRSRSVSADPSDEMAIDKTMMDELAEIRMS